MHLELFLTFLEYPKFQEKSRTLGEAVSRARPYYDALRKSKKQKQRTHHLANQYTRGSETLQKIIYETFDFLCYYFFSSTSSEGS